ncbi:hypothetical protein GCM10023153_31150 [Ornithinibacter aureus]|uniref:AAA domain-containing protein n=1 Tax=Ornithinibacter aureus TaxID=622664 RepID=A0ABP8K8V5_9MICO|nr:AAA family ATPase [Ornithinibacter aureus]
MALGRRRHWSRQSDPGPCESAALRTGDLLVVDEAEMLDQDAARALLTLAEEAGARVAFIGDRHQLAAVGRGGVLDHAVAYADPAAVVTLETVRQFTDEAYAILSLRMREGYRSDEVFDALLARGQIVCTAPTSSAQRRSRASVRPATSSWPTPANRSPTSTRPSARSARTSIPSQEAARR